METLVVKTDDIITQEKAMAEPQETQQEKEARWATHRASRDTQQKNWRAARARTRVGSWLVVGVVVIVAFIAVIMLL